MIQIKAKNNLGKTRKLKQNSPKHQANKSIQSRNEADMNKNRTTKKFGESNTYRDGRIAAVRRRRRS